MGHTTTSDLLASHQYHSDRSFDALQQRLMVLEALVARTLQSTVPDLNWDVSEDIVVGNGTSRIWLTLKAAGYQITSIAGTGFNRLEGNGLDVKAKDLEQVKQIALNHYHCNLAALAGVR